MLFIILFVVIFSTYIWLFYEPQRTSDNHQRIDKDKLRVEIVDNRTPIPEQSESIAATEQLTTDTEAATEELAPLADASPEEMPSITPVEEPQAEPAIATNEDLTSEEVEIEPVLTEEEAIALAVETALASDDTPDASPSDQDSVPDLIRPHAPDPELVEAAIRDAEEKAEDFSPPEIANT